MLFILQVSILSEQTVLTEVELVGLVCASWNGPGGLPDVRDRQRAFYTYGRVKMSYMSVRG